STSVPRRDYSGWSSPRLSRWSTIAVTARNPSAPQASTQNGSSSTYTAAAGTTEPPPDFGVVGRTGRPLVSLLVPDGRGRSRHDPSARREVFSRRAPCGGRRTGYTRGP